MSNNELLLQISELLDVKLKATENRLRQEIREVRTELQAEIQQVKADVQRIDLKLENNVIPRLQNIESCYLDTYNRYISEVEKAHALEMDVDILKKVVSEHSEKLKNIS